MVEEQSKWGNNYLILKLDNIIFKVSICNFSSERNLFCLDLDASLPWAATSNS